MSGNDYGSFNLNDDVISINVNEIVRGLRRSFERDLLDQPIAINDSEFQLAKTETGQGGHRYWFLCPGCGKRVTNIYLDTPIAACRNCLGLKYPSSRYKGMIEAIPKRSA